MSVTRTPSGRAAPPGVGAPGVGAPGGRDGAGETRGTAHARWLIALAALALAAVLLTWVGSGVAISEVARFLAFEALWVVLPGCLLYLLLSPVPGGRLRTLAIGWPLGYAVVVAAFALTADLSIRWAFTLLPPAAVVLFGGALFLMPSRRGRIAALLAGETDPAREGDLAHEQDPAREGAPTRSAHTSARTPPAFGLVAVAATAAVLLLSFTFFASYPLPRNSRSVEYSEDNVFDITLAGEARHHWPVSESWIAGEPLHYYKGVFIDAAAVNQVMGVSLATLFLRLLPSMMFLIAALQLWALGGTLGRGRWVGPLASALLLMTQDINLDPTRTQILQINPFTQFPLSPSFALGVPFFLGGLLLVQATDWKRPWGAATLGLLALVGILTAGLGAAKAFGVVDFVGGVGLYWLWQLARGQLGNIRAALAHPLTWCIAVAGIVVIAVYFLLLAGGGAATMSVDPLAFLTQSNTLENATKAAKHWVGSSLYWLPLLFGAAALAVLALAPLLGAVWAVWQERGANERTALLLATFAVGIGCYVLLGAPGGVEGVFFVYGYIALLPVAALGLIELWQRTPTAVRAMLIRSCAAVLAIGLLAATLSASLPFTGTTRDAWLVAAYAGTAVAAALAVRRLQPRYRAIFSARSTCLVACCLPLLTTLALVKPLTLTGSGAWKTLVGKPIAAADTGVEYGMTAQLYHGLLWVRAHTTPCDVLAVNNHYDNAKHEESVYFYYSAFTERRVFLESWRYTAGGQTGGLPYPWRYQLNERAVTHGEPQALRELARIGVKYVLVDKTHAGGASEPASVSTLVYASPVLDVYRLHPVGPPRGCAAIA
jgi:hypothetical protein